MSETGHADSTAGAPRPERTPLMTAPHVISVATGTVGTLTAGRGSLERHSHGVSVAEAGRIVNVSTSDLDAARRMLTVDALGGAVHRTLEARVGAGAPEDAAERLFGVD